MIIDIQRIVIKTQLRRLITLLLVVLAILIVVFLGSLQNDFLGINKYQWGLIIFAVYIISVIIEGLLELNYIYFSDEEGAIIFRYFPMSLFSRKKNSIEIPLERFAGYEIIESFGGLKKQIIFYHKLKKGSAKYKPVSITGLNKEQLQTLIKTLNRHKG
jgi:hypothetical protein